MRGGNSQPRPTERSRFIHEAPPPDLRCDFAVKPFDEAMRAAERKWGINRLPSLVSPETAKKWGSAFQKMQDAIEARDADECAVRAAVCVRGLAAMDAEAESAGKQTLPSGALAGDVEGFRFVVLPDHRCWPQYQDQFPGHVMLTLQQIGIVMRDHLENGPVVAEARKHFPAAKVKAVRPLERSEFLDDEIPWF